MQSGKAQEMSMYSMKMLITLIAICGGFAVAFFGVIVLFNFHVWLGFVLCVTGITSAIMGTKIYE